MMMKHAVVPVAVLLMAACLDTPPAGPARGDVELSAAYIDEGFLLTWEDLERWDGETVSLTGKFDHVEGTHGVVQLNGGLRILIPHFDKFARGMAWGEFVGGRVRVKGILHSYYRPDHVPGHVNPTLEIRSFEVLQQPPPP